MHPKSVWYVPWNIIMILKFWFNGWPPTTLRRRRASPMEMTEERGVKRKRYEPPQEVCH